MPYQASCRLKKRVEGGQNNTPPQPLGAAEPPDFDCSVPLLGPIVQDNNATSDALPCPAQPALHSSEDGTQSIRHTVDTKGDIQCYETTTALPRCAQTAPSQGPCEHGINIDTSVHNDIGSLNTPQRRDRDEPLSIKTMVVDTAQHMPPVGASHSLGATDTMQPRNVADASAVEPDVHSDGEIDGVGVSFLNEMQHIYETVHCSGVYNFAGSRQRIPSGLNIESWRRYIDLYDDINLPEYLEFGWPINLSRAQPLIPSFSNHFSAQAYSEHVDFYIQTELGFNALLGPFARSPVDGTHTSPLMTREKKNCEHRRVIVDLSFPKGFSINDGIHLSQYIDGPLNVKLPTVHSMESRILELGQGAFLYKTDLARGYRQLRVDPMDWGYLAFQHKGQTYIDVCPPFGLRSSAMMMVRTTSAITKIHKSKGFQSEAYIDDFGGAEKHRTDAKSALTTLQDLFLELGMVQADNKVCEPSQVMTWLGIEFNTIAMTMTLPEKKLLEVVECVREWGDRKRATLKQIQSLFGLLQFVACVAPPAKLFTNRILDAMREIGSDNYTSLSWGFKRDLKFFSDLLPQLKGVKLMQKEDFTAHHILELDACLSGCGAICGDQYYGRTFPDSVRSENHPIAHLELLNVVVAVKMWSGRWAGHRVRIICDNMNAVLAVHSGRTKDPFMQHCARELHLYCACYDIELLMSHAPGVEMQRADALSREHLDQKFRGLVAADPSLQQSTRVVPDDRFFMLINEL